MTAALQPKGTVSLVKWASSKFAKVPHINTLRKWAREKQIEPAPKLFGREYFVQPAARYVGKKENTK
jgi:hypothetical protein